MPNFGKDGNSAYAGAAVGPGYSRQVAAINPANPVSKANGEQYSKHWLNLTRGELIVFALLFKYVKYQTQVNTYKALSC